MCVCQIILICIIIMYIYFFWVLYVVKILRDCLVTYTLLSLSCMHFLKFNIIKLIMYAFPKIYTTVHLSPNKCIQEVT